MALAPARLAAQLKSVAVPDFTVPEAARRQLVLTADDGATLEWVCTPLTGSALVVFVYLADPRGTADTDLRLKFGKAPRDSWQLLGSSPMSSGGDRSAKRSDTVRETYLQLNDQNGFTRNVLGAAGDTVRMKYPVVTGRAVFPRFAVPADAGQTFAQFYQDCGGKALP